MYYENMSARKINCFEPLCQPNFYMTYKQDLLRKLNTQK